MTAHDTSDPLEPAHPSEAYFHGTQEPRNRTPDLAADIRRALTRLDERLRICTARERPVAYRAAIAEIRRVVT
jgi:hypothetical protein